MSKIIEGKAPRPDGQKYDHVEIKTTSRWKESELSGDEYRISVTALVYYKSNLILSCGFRDVADAIRYLDGSLLYLPRERFNYVDDSYLCDQETCSNMATVKYKRLKGYSPEYGHPYELSKYELYRVFCESHKHRGDCALDDGDHNYITVEFTDEEKNSMAVIRTDDDA